MPEAVELLNPTRVRDAFDCGSQPLNDFLTRYASQYQKRNLARTYVLVKLGDPKVLGYYTLASSAITFNSLPADQTMKLPKHPVPVVLLARLAVDRSVGGQGFGGRLLRECFARGLQLAAQIGIDAITVDAIDEQAAKFYEHFGFMRFPQQTGKLFISLDTIRQAFGC
jgi:GNAT superfamily N-acetyltransferase